MDILIKNVLLNGKKTDVSIKDGVISEIGSGSKDDKVIDGSGKAVIPSFVNMHTHSAMTLFRGYADDMALMPWLEEKIWPLESKLDEKLVYKGSKLACLEMIKNGTTSFVDMYWHVSGTAKAVSEMGLRGYLSGAAIDLFDADKHEQQVEKCLQEIKSVRSFGSDKIVPVVGAHAIYTVSGELLKSMKDIADENNLMYHIHISETKGEVDECIKKNGVRPVKYLDNLGVLGENFIGAHGVWLDDEEMKLLEQRGGCVVHNPVSNMKLAVGSVLDYKGLISNSVNVCLGSDGCASNNNLDMFEEMKVAALLQKSYYNDPRRLTSREVFEMATVKGYKALGLKGGKIEEGFIADLCLVDLSEVMMIPNHNLVSNLVYSANGSVVDTVVCGGDVLMENRVVKDEDKIVEEGIGAAEEIVGDGS